VEVTPQIFRPMKTRLNMFIATNQSTKQPELAALEQSMTCVLDILFQWNICCYGNNVCILAHIIYSPEIALYCQPMLSLLALFWAYGFFQSRIKKNKCFPLSFKFTPGSSAELRFRLYKGRFEHGDFSGNVFVSYTEIQELYSNRFPTWWRSLHHHHIED
jgi:hypothetical protein